MIDVRIDPEVVGLAVGLVVVDEARIGPADATFAAYRDEVVARVRQDGMAGGDERREAVRRLLRAGGYKPAGRNKPAQEYLARTVTEQGLPSINAAVDVLNVVSLASGLPISLASLARLGSAVSLRYGRPGERFVFNRAGQELELEGLLCLCSGHGPDSIPLGTPVKDSMTGKIDEQDHALLACIYAPSAAVATEELQRWCDELANGLRRWTGASQATTQISTATRPLR